MTATLKGSAADAVYANHALASNTPSIPTTPGYSSMFTGMDVFGTDVVALRHKGGLGTHVKTLAEVLGVPWEKFEITWGNTTKNLPWSCPSGGSQTIHAMTRAAHAVGLEGKRLMAELASLELGGKPEDYDVGGERGGHIVAAGPPEAIAKTPQSHTGKFLAGILYGNGKPRGNGRT